MAAISITALSTNQAAIWESPKCQISIQKFIDAALAVLFALGVSANAAQGQEFVDGSSSVVGDENARIAADAVKELLIDPSSAQFKRFSFLDKKHHLYPENYICGLVNAKNRFGGYVGFTPFAYQRLRKEVTLLSPADTQNEFSGELSKLAFKFTGCASVLGI